MRTTEEILARVKEVRAGDILGFEVPQLVDFLPFDAAREFLNPDVTADQWPAKQPTDDAIRAQIADYMPFAIEKATNQRGISASRSIGHMRSWLWLLGDDELMGFVEDDGNYRPYGMPILKRICDRLGLAFPTDEDAQRMANGDACRPYCDDGCSH